MRTRPWVPEDIFFLIDTDGSRRIRVNEAQSAERKKELRTDEGVTNWRPSSDSELIARMEMRLLACVTRGPSREPYRKHGLFHAVNGPLEPRYADPRPPSEKILT